MIDTAGTIIKAADALFDNGAAEVVVAATHAVLSGPAVDRLKNSRIGEVVVTNTLPIPEDRQVRQAHGPLDRPAPGPGHPRGLRRRFGHQPLRRQRLKRLGTRVAPFPYPHQSLPRRGSDGLPESSPVSVIDAVVSAQ